MKTDKLYLIHILERIERIEEYTGDGREAFFRDKKGQDAVMRNFEVIGEAAKRISLSLRRSHQDVPWKRLAGFRDVLIHRYEGVDFLEVWNIVEQEMPRLKRRVTEILEELGGP